jgi:uncharacterized protein (TIGR02145 family)
VERDNQYDSGGIDYMGDIIPVQIGEQVWMSKNFNFNVKGSKCYDNQESNCATYGRLYDWATAMALPAICNSAYCKISEKHKGICPGGWHIPSKADWEKLIRYVGGEKTAGLYLKATNGWNDNGNGEDKYGFSALPGGYGKDDGSFYDVVGTWWSADGDGSYSGGNYAYSLYVDNKSASSGGNNYKSDLRSVRCLQD